MTKNELMDEIYAQKFPRLYDETIPVLAGWLAKRFPEILGSAETGGEKADDCACGHFASIHGKHGCEFKCHCVARFPTFRRSSQNQTATSGVEGAHEGTTADKSACACGWCYKCAGYHGSECPVAASPELLPTQLPKEK